MTQRNHLSLKTLSIVALLLASSAQAQLYKSVGADGKITYSDTPPPASAKVQKKIETGSNNAESTNLPYEVSQAVKASPVTLYTTVSCPACDDGRKLLSERGIPFSEKTVRTADDIQKLKEAGGDTQLPYMLIGRVKQRGYQASAWNANLTAAGYPEANMLPKTYRSPRAEPAAPPPVELAPEQKAAAPAAEPAQPAPTTARPAAAGNAPPGFKF